MRVRGTLSQRHRPLIVLALAIACLFVGPRTATAASPPATLPALQQLLQGYVDAYHGGGEVAVAVTDLQTGQTIAVNGNRPQLAGCTINLFVLMEATRGVELGEYPEPRIGDLISTTTWSSNPVSAHDLYAILGGGDAQAGLEVVVRDIADLGLKDVVLDHPPGFFEDRVGVSFNNWMTAVDTNAALQELWSGLQLKPQWRDYLLQKLNEVKPGLNYLTAYGPDGVVSHKNGFFHANDGTWVDNDAAIVRFDRGGKTYAYAISFFSQWVPEKYADIGLGQEISTATWDFFSRRYP